MSSRTTSIDNFFLFSTAALTVIGFVIFLSASLGLLAQTDGTYTSIAAKQGISLLIGITLFFVFSRIKYTFFKKTAILVLIGAILVNLLLFIPSIALHYNGASRWINLGFISFQPSELLKIASIIYFAAWINFAKERLNLMRFGLFPYMGVMTILGILLLIQSDTDTLAIIAFTGIIMFMVAGMPLRHVALSLMVLTCVILGVIYFRPYALERIKVYFHPTENIQGSGYQINQSLIAIGSGGFLGRGFGQSIQKFGYLPQPTDDSIFAVAAEEFGFIGSVLLITFYCLFATSAFRIASRTQDLFGAMLSMGIGVLVVTESFLNIAAMLGILPISGLPLLFVSHGGTALIIILVISGIVANVSKYTNRY